MDTGDGTVRELDARGINDEPFERVMDALAPLPEDGKEEPIVTGLATHLIAPLGSHVDSVHLCECEGPLTEL